MGNWRTVELIGKVSPEQAKEMIEFLEQDLDNMDWEKEENHDAEFIAAAPQYIRDLLSTIKSLQEENERLNKEIEKVPEGN